MTVDYSRWDIFEIRDTKLMTGDGLLHFADKEAAWKDYQNLGKDR